MLSLEEYITYKDTERFLDSLAAAKPLPHYVTSKHQIIRRIPFGLERVESFLQQIGNPHLQNNYIHITGTSGKTSTAYLTANLLYTQGYRTGLFTSPHICTFAEVFMLDMRLPPVREIVDLINQLKPAIDHEYEQKEFGFISHFEFLLSAALQYFTKKHAEYVVLEVGLGGRHDATNVIKQAEVSIITNIDLDHTHILGGALQEIATEKIGIIKQGCPLVTAEKRPEILAIFREEADKFNAELHILGKDFSIENVRTGRHETMFDYVSEKKSYRALQTSLCGAYQAKNAALAIRALEIVSDRNNKPIDEDAFRKGLLSILVPGRYEQVRDDPGVILDGAHNPDKIAHLVAFLKSKFNKNEVIFLCGFTSGRNPEEMLRMLFECSQTFYLTRALTGGRESEEPLYLKSVLTSLNPLVEPLVTLDPFVALDMAMEHAKKTGKVLCVTGSLYLISYLRQHWYPEHQVLRYV